MNKISVVIPTMNTRPDWLRESVASVNNQSIKPDEIIIVNNGIDYLNKINTAIPYKVVQTVYRAGASQARNIGAAFSKGEYISFLDDDDLWEKDYIKKVLKIINENGKPDMVVARLDKLHNDKIRFFKEPNKLDKNTIIIRNPSITGSSVTVKKSSFNKVSGYDVKLITGEDKSLALDFLLKGFKVIGSSNIQAIHRVHEQESLSSFENYKVGHKQFIIKYKYLMDVEQLIVNYSRLLMYHLLSSNNLLFKKASFIPRKVHHYFKRKVENKING